MITSKKLLKQKKISHGFFNRNGGSSSGIYKSLNCGPGSNDNKNNIKKNLKIVKNRINKKSKKIFLIHQIHSNKFIFIDRNFKLDTRKIKVDAIVTDRRKFPIGVLTADCAPILLFDKKKKFIAAIHAGWKGAFKGIITKVIKFMIRKGCKPKNIVAAKIAEKCEIQISYAIGVAEPTSIFVDTFGTSTVEKPELENIIRENFDLRPKGIIKMLDLKKPIYQDTAAYGHFGRDDKTFSWELIDKAKNLIV